jgi:hypothetical protein
MGHRPLSAGGAGAETLWSSPPRHGTGGEGSAAETLWFIDPPPRGVGAPRRFGHRPLAAALVARVGRRDPLVIYLSLRRAPRRLGHRPLPVRGSGRRDPFGLSTLLREGWAPSATWSSAPSPRRWRLGLGAEILSVIDPSPRRWRRGLGAETFWSSTLLREGLARRDPCHRPPPRSGGGEGWTPCPLGHRPPRRGAGGEGWAPRSFGRRPLAGPAARVGRPLAWPAPRPHSPRRGLAPRRFRSSPPRRGACHPPPGGKPPRAAVLVTRLENVAIIASFFIREKE